MRYTVNYQTDRAPLGLAALEANYNYYKAQAAYHLKQAAEYQKRMSDVYDARVTMSKEGNIR